MPGNNQGNQMFQVAPWPHELEKLVDTFHYKPGWRFRLVQDLDRDYEPDDVDRERPPIGRGTTLIITSLTYNSYREYESGDPPDYRVNHFKIVPPATFNWRAWRRWILDMCIEIEIHETCEFARWFNEDGDDDRPFAPHHGPGENPYSIIEIGTVEETKMKYTGELNP